MPGLQPIRKEKIIKKILDKKNDGMKKEYDFDYSEAKKNRFADLVKEKVILYPIDEDVADVFRNPVEANNALRAIIKAIPGKPRKKQLSKKS